MDSIYLHDSNSVIPIPEEYQGVTMNISSLVDIPEASCSELYVEGTFFNEKTLIDIIKKIRIAGKITITGPDIIEISRSILCGYLTEKDVRNLISPGEVLYSCLEIISALERGGLEIISKRINHNRFAVIAERT
jgi:hypothetical protein